MSDDGYLQTKISMATEDIKELQKIIKTLQMNYDSLDRRISAIEPEIKKIINIDSIIKNSEETLKSRNNDFIKKQSMLFTELIEKKISECMDIKLKDKLKLYEGVCEKTINVTTKLMNDVGTLAEYGKALNELSQRVDSLASILVGKKITSVRELQQDMNNHKKRFLTKEIRMVLP